MKKYESYATRSLKIQQAAKAKEAQEKLEALQNRSIGRKVLDILKSANILS